MIALDTNAVIAYLSGAAGAQVDGVDAALASHAACLPPMVLTELLSDPKLPGTVRRLLLDLPLLSPLPGFWERAGDLRAAVIAKRHKGRLADALIAQTCLDHDVPLLTLDRDFRHFVPAGLRLL